MPVRAGCRAVFCCPSSAGVPMNKIYSLVWNASLRQVVAVSELAKGSGGGCATCAKPRSRVRRALALAVSLAVGALPVLLATAPQPASAQVAIGNGVYTNDANCTNPSASVPASVAIGCGDSANGSGSTALGTGVTVNGNNSIGLGTSVNVTTQGSIGLGYSLTS